MQKFLLLLLSVLFPLSIFSQPIYVPAEGLIGWYPFSGNANDNSGNGHNGTVNAATLTSDRFGNANSAYLFNGSTTSISTDLQGPTGNAGRTIACWFRYTGFPNLCNTQGVLAGYGASDAGCGQGGKNYSLEVNYGIGGPTGWVDGVCMATYQNNDTLDTNWHFMAAVYDSSYGNFFDIKLYVDGEFKQTAHILFANSPDVITDTLSKLLIGAGHYACQRFFKGGIDDIGVWGRALQINELYDLYRGQPYVHSDSSLVYLDNLCTNMQFTISPVHYTPGMTVTTWFGDGNSQTDSFSSSTQLAVISHTYSYTVNYPVKHVIYRNAVAIDTVNYSYDYQFCRTLPIRFYADNNADCNYNIATEPPIFQPITMAVDSAGVPIDTVSATSGLNYYAYGPPGTIYNFTAIELMPGVAITCPALGVITDTLSATNNPPKNVGMQCTGTPGFDLQLYATGRVGFHRFSGMVIANNTYCTPTMGALTMHMNPHYTSQASYYPPPISIAGNDVTWNVSNLSSILSNPAVFYANMEGVGPIGDTLCTPYDIVPTTGDMNPVDNVIIHCDTITGSYDPNYVAVSPEGCLQPNVTKLTYTVHFENTGNDTAFNISVLDTIPDYLNVMSLRMLTASAAMNIGISKSGGYTVARFDFLHINLLDSSHHGQCEGMFVYTINLKNGLPNNTQISNRAGIYFDDNAVVMTNSAENVTGCPTSVHNVKKADDVQIYPNPADNDFIITASNTYTTFSLTNVFGDVVLQQPLQPKQTKVDIRNLPAGVYYLTLHGGDASLVRKVIKL
jgi:hypothetical protein